MLPSSNDPRKINNPSSDFEILSNELKSEIINLGNENKNIMSDCSSVFNTDILELIELIQALHYLDKKYKM